MRTFIACLLLYCISFKAYSQLASLSGTVKDENGTPLSYAPVVLLQPADSTMAYYSVTNEHGLFEIKSIKNGRYLLEATLMGHLAVFRVISVPVEQGNNIGTIILKSNPIALKEVVVSEEHVPLQFRHDTVEFNTAAYLTKPDAVVEDLLKKLPGIEVDRAGNIKAMGEDVKKVLVDGREFFGSDPKLATRNVPADALRKVQVYDKKSDESEFTGIDDGTRDKTLNLLLKENRKNAIFGELLSGAGNNKSYQESAKAYRFTDKNQIAGLGMLNNINQFGFSFKDYIDFNGGLNGFMNHGGGVQIKLQSNEANSFPVNFGQAITGLSTSGAAGFNFSHVFKKDSRIFMSYIANGSNRDLNQTTYTRNYSPFNSFRENDSLRQSDLNRNYRLNFGLRDRIDSTQNIIINGGASVSTGRTNSRTGSILYSSDSDQNKLSAVRTNNGNRFNGSMNGSYLKLINKGSVVFKASADASYSHDLGKSTWLTNTYLFDPGTTLNNGQFQDNSGMLSELSLSSSLTIKIARSLYIEPGINAGNQTETLKRIQGFPADIKTGIDSLSPDFQRKYQWIKPELKLIRNVEKMQFELGLQAELSRTMNSLNGDHYQSSNHFYFTPDMSWEYEYKPGRRLRANFETLVNVPAVNQLLPVTDNSNPLDLSSGNRFLKPEINYNMALNWWIFDQFSFTTLLTDLSAGYTKDKINWSRTVGEDLRQNMSLVNVPDDYMVRGSADFSTPVRQLGIKINTNVEEIWNRGLNYVNSAENVNINLTHKLSLSIENRKKTKFDITAGGSVQITNAKFSIQKSLNNRYIDYSYFTDIRYTPGKQWNMLLTTEVTRYSAESFSSNITIPLLGAELTYYFLKNYRGAITIQGTDLLNRNTGIERSSEFNYLREQRSNMLGRLLMISFKYKLNKFGDSQGGMDIKIKRR